MPATPSSPRAPVVIIARRSGTAPVGTVSSMARKQRWSDLSSRQRAGVLGLIAVQAVLAAMAQRDLSSRDKSQVRGPKVLWRIATLNTLGVIAYLVVGRR
jgi:hypothetical protein